jgi:hypothetical protein
LTEERVGTAAITAGAYTVMTPQPPYTYLGVAEGLLPGITVLSAAGSPVALANALLCAHALECLLKAACTRTLGESALKGNDVRHNLTALWDHAVAAGVPLPVPAPSWLARISPLHDAPYHLRYSKGVNGIVLPPMEPMVSDIKHAAVLVRASMA